MKSVWGTDKRRESLAERWLIWAALRIPWLLPTLAMNKAAALMNRIHQISTQELLEHPGLPDTVRACIQLLRDAPNDITTWNEKQLHAAESIATFADENPQDVRDVFEAAVKRAKEQS